MTIIPIHPAEGGAAEGEPLGILARRRIEAEIIKPIYEIMKREFGIERAQAVIAEAVRGAARDAGRAFAAKEPGGTSIASFVALQGLWEKDDALDVDVRRADDAHYDYDVRRCAYAQMYREMGLGEIGHLLSCARDSVFIEGYDPRIALTRTRTLMQGGTHCDFRYRLAEPPEDGAREEAGGARQTAGAQRATPVGPREPGLHGDASAALPEARARGGETSAPQGAPACEDARSASREARSHCGAPDEAGKPQADGEVRAAPRQAHVRDSAFDAPQPADSRAKPEASDAA
ncbi:L-2-amino-thiazoline-4-carboxylic acid hydrolase [Burkholderia oklahomensis]|uniref:L-2-amino-thiazoline-4-carboxylic acid hydrolase family protein n=2 Tax=Burkholderia oklahomensis TaxID=342113 RepID=A0AAI8BC86_9BURK|nr:L-2-amino-thiazoline-4-carboxylic acid hydrolase [Burkholderia oklahomensis]AIO70173.1 L-2-amino-thiazoline-4-carboxylic acid hydrolase family protein [Burkholderia oklahomensis]QPS40128.1 L-2-amino-thiazoline-4-carboxylic acid hydrolase [Burkholderia oklahomensis]